MALLTLLYNYAHPCAYVSHTKSDLEYCTIG